MQTRLARMVIAVIGVAIGLAAAYLLKDLDTQLRVQRLDAEMLRERARLLTTEIADLRAGQFAYVAEGQGKPFWLTHVTGLMPTVQKRMADFRGSLTAAAAHEALDPAAAAIENFATIDARVKEYVSAGNLLLAGELIFSDSLEATATATSRIAAALSAEMQVREAAIGELHRREAIVAGGTAGCLLFLLIALAIGGTRTPVTSEVPAAVPHVDPVKFETPVPPRAKPAITPKLITTARLCGDLARVNQTRELPKLLERTARVLEASGIIVWVADASAEELRPVMAHGYTEQVVGRMGGIPCNANNAAAAAFRTAQLRSVAGENGAMGAIVAPLMTADGCVGVLSAEMRGGSEKDESSQALASIFAAQLATIVSPPQAAVVTKAAAEA